MSDAPPPPSGSDAAGPDDGPAQLSPLPFLIALGCFSVVVVLAWFFLRDDDPGRLVRPDAIQVVDDTRIRLLVEGPFRDDYAEITKVGYALGDDAVFVEVVVDEYGCPDDAACAAPTQEVLVEVVLPEPIDGREVRSGTGRTLVDCDRTSPVPTCR